MRGWVLLALVALVACEQGKDDKPAEPVAAAKAQGEAAGQAAADVTREAAARAQNSALAAAGTAEAGAATAPLAGLKRSGPIACTGIRTITLDHVDIDGGDDPAVEMSGKCTIAIRHSHLRSRDAALSLSGVGTVTIEDSVIEGDESVSASGMVTVSVRNSRLAGDKNLSGAVRWNDQGGNRFE